MNGYIVTADVVSFLFTLVILLGVLFGSEKPKKRSTRAFIGLTVTALLSNAINASSYLADGASANDALLRVANLLPYIFIVILIDVFSVYMVTFIREKAELSYRALIPMFLTSALNIVMVIVGTANEKLFAIIDHKYVAKEWDIGVYVFALIYMIYLGVILIRYRKKLGTKSVLGLGAYLVFPTLLSSGVILFGMPEFSCAATALALLVIYMIVQRRNISEVLLRKEILEEISHVDALTGLKNRRAYDEFLRNSDSKDNAGIAFFDLNSLKHTNDTYGHGAGDRLIKSFADMLRSAFGSGEVFRISGDEFVVSLNPASQEDMERQMASFGELIYSKDRIAAMGYVYGDGDKLRMVHEAEKKMYKDKALYYKETGRDRRA